VKRTVAIINRAAITVRFEFDNTASVLADRNADESGILLSLTGTKAIAIAVLYLTGVGVASEVSLALELARGAPAVTLDGEFTAVAGVVARGVVVGEALIIDGLTSVVDDSKARVVTICVATGRTRDCGKVTGGPDDLEVLSVDASRGSH
jgi:hypothetical protein